MPEATDTVVSWHPVDGAIMHIVLDRPPANALGVPIIEGLSAALDEAERLAGIHVLVISSALPNFFAAGADIKHMASADGAAFSAYGDGMRAVFNRLATADHLSVAAVEGLALGGGLELAMACTLRVAGRAARFGLPEVKLGLIPGAGGTQRLPRLVGRSRALDMMLTARQVSAEEAHEIGLIDRLVDEGSAEAAALQLAGELCSASLPAQQAVIRTVDAAFDMTLPDGFGYEAAQVLEVFENGEGKEGIAAFIEKRPPKFA
ncbi:MAG TPA: enoyl-CoA hydratase-related protein [Jatrophihabitans sp.]|jgi:enoyl-CoA hydratase